MTLFDIMKQRTSLPCNGDSSAKSTPLPCKKLEVSSHSCKEDAEAQREAGVDGEKEKKGAIARGNWGGKLEFILACIGYAVGLGNVWRFPYLCFKNGGGAFLIPYWCMQVFVGMPLFFLELSWGQFASLGPITIWKASLLFKGLGYCMIITSTFVAIYYNVIIGYGLFYLFASMASPLPWSHCNHTWSSPGCVVTNVTDLSDALVSHVDHSHEDMDFDASHESVETSLSDVTGSWNETVAGAASESAISATAIAFNSTVSPSENFFFHYVLGVSEGMEDMGGVQWKLALCLLLSWVIVFVVLIRGIKSLGKVVYFTATFPYILLTAMLIRGATLDGASEGIKYYLTPQWERLADSQVWADAAAQIFFTLGACSGGTLLLSSYNQFHNNCFRDALIVPIVDCCTSFFCGLVVFSVLGFMAHAKRVPVDQVAASGPGLAFVAYPEAIANMPAPTVWAILFFFMLLIIGFSSQFSIMETVMSSIMDEYPGFLRKSWKHSTIFRLCACVVFFILALPMTTKGGIYLLDVVDASVSGFPLLFVGLIECVAISHVYGYQRLAGDIEMMLGRKPWLFWRYCWCFKTPVVLGAVIVFKAIEFAPLHFQDYVYPGWAQVLGWLVVACPLGAIPLFFLCHFCRQGGWQALKKAAQPTQDWGPALPENRTGRYASANHLREGQADHALPSIYVTPDSAHIDNNGTAAGGRYVINEAFELDPTCSGDLGDGDLLDVVVKATTSPSVGSSRSHSPVQKKRSTSM